MTPAELHVALREIVAAGRRGGYDNDEIADQLGRFLLPLLADAYGRGRDDEADEVPLG